jgi:uncharacterized protein YneF (UPF0154 family)
VVAQVIGAAVALVIGMATGFFFERRSTNEALRQNAELRRELREVRESVYTVGAQHRNHAQVGTQTDQDLASELLLWARTVQDPSGRVDRRRALMNFAEAGRSADDLAEALAVLEQNGSITLSDHYLELQ